MRSDIHRKSIWSIKKYLDADELSSIKAKSNQKLTFLQVSHDYKFHICYMNQGLVDIFTDLKEVPMV